eukprot:Plantae.Rhodophyta-Hildenbrandia_rubra.ctg6127.p1 GENE.Plantae.Rhodophyta-Hildenbrandia_rubra.ctg6127~~Plantae.Rhodophyta-Hildenbrandia_rubra.ctg6127.p1  ORF type:complete len:259 (+),score=20.76 Plantae.Rhodophyta-Hildenbrandia_rubra.ctg6127:504-1280(+)
MSSINRRHEDFGRLAPAKGPLITAAKKGLSRLQQQAADALPPASAPLPASFVGQVLSFGLHASSLSARRQAAFIVLALLSFARPGATGVTKINDVRMRDNCIEAQLRAYKRDIGRDRLTFRAPFSSQSRIWDLLHAVQVDLRKAGCPDDAYLFRPARGPQAPLSNGDLSAAARKFLSHFRAQPPLGRKHTGRSARSGAVSSAYAIGVDMETMRWMWGSKSMDTLRQHHLGPRAKPTPSAEEFFGRLKRAISADGQSNL